MPATYLEAIDQMVALHKAAWDAQSAAIAGSIPPVTYPGMQQDATPPNDTFWSEFVYETINDDQLTLNGDIDGNGKRRYIIEGVLIVVIHTPSASDAYRKGQQLALVVQGAFKGKETSGGVRFSRVRIKEPPMNSLGTPFDVVIDYEHEYIG